MGDRNNIYNYSQKWRAGITGEEKCEENLTQRIIKITEEKEHTSHIFDEFVNEWQKYL